jgi:hypothetical protein
MGEVAIGSLAARAEYIRLLFAVSRIIFAFLSPVPVYNFRMEIAWIPKGFAFQTVDILAVTPPETQPCPKSEF